MSLSLLYDWMIVANRLPRPAGAMFFVSDVVGHVPLDIYCVGRFVGIFHMSHAVGI